ncbi:MAG: 50S ribosomal protein L29 [Gammaproteobacteria bacterium]
MKANVIREMKPDMRKQEILALLKEQFNLRMQKSSKQLTHTHQLKRIRRDIARLRTIMHEQEGVA